DEQLALSLDAEKRALAAGNYEKAGRRAYDSGWIHGLRGQAAEVLACADRAEAHWREAKTGARERATAIQLRGHGYKSAKDYPSAIAACREAVDLWRSLGRETKDVATGLNALAEAERMSDDLDSAERDYR